MLQKVEGEKTCLQSKKPIKKNMARPRKEVDTSTYTGRFAQRLKMLRERRGLSVQELSEKSGIPLRTLYDWESSTSQPLIGQLPELAKALEIKTRTLLPSD